MTKWENFQPSSLPKISLSLSLLSLTAFQLTLLLLKHSSTFFGLSSVFMTTNAILTITIVFMSTYKAGTSVVEFLKEVEQEERNQTGIQQEEEKEGRMDMGKVEFTHNLSDLKDQLIENSILTGGLIGYFAKKKGKAKSWIMLGIYFAAFGALGGYAYLDDHFRDKSKLGLITAIAVIGTDVIIYLYSQSEIYTSPAEISLHLALFRICLFVLGGTYWIYGYSLLYTYFGIYLVYNIAIIRFPFLEDIMKPEGEKKDKEGQENKFNIASTPEFLLFFSTILYFVLLSVMKAVKPRGVPLEDVELYDKTFQFWVYGLFSILLVLIIFFMILTYRTFRRKMNGIDSKTSFYVYSEKIDLFWFFLSLLYFLLAIASVATYFISEDYRYL